MSPKKYLKCVYCNCVYEPIDYDKHTLCEEFYNFILDGMIKKLEARLQKCYQIKQKNPKEGARSYDKIQNS